MGYFVKYYWTVSKLHKRCSKSGLLNKSAVGKHMNNTGHQIHFDKKIHLIQVYQFCQSSVIISQPSSKTLTIKYVSSYDQCGYLFSNLVWFTTLQLHFSLIRRRYWSGTVWYSVSVEKFGLWGGLHSEFSSGLHSFLLFGRVSPLNWSITRVTVFF